MTDDAYTGNRSLVLVHGKDFKPKQDEYFDFALAALAAGIERDYPDACDSFKAIEMHRCFYGDLTNELLFGMGKHYDEVLDLGDRRNALAAMTLLDKRKHFGVSRYDRLPGKTAATEFFVDIGTSLLNLLGFSKPLVARYSKDVNEYWYGDGSYASAVRERVREQLTGLLDRDDKILLVSHGTGSIVAYDVLWELSHKEEYAERFAGRKVDTWVTLGSPLGDNLVRKRLFGADNKGRDKYPNVVVSWHNIAAEDDYMCHDNTLADDFRPMLKKRLVSSIRDYKIYNLAVRYGKSNPHSSIGYYIHPRLAQIAVEWLKSGSHERLHPNTSQ